MLKSGSLKFIKKMLLCYSRLRTYLGKISRDLLYSISQPSQPRICFTTTARLLLVGVPYTNPVTNPVLLPSPALLCLSDPVLAQELLGVARLDARTPARTTSLRMLGASRRSRSDSGSTEKAKPRNAFQMLTGEEPR